MKRILIILLTALEALTAEAKVDTLRISSAYTTHIIFSTDLTYADLSNSRYVVAKIIEQNKNMLALKAKEPFSESCSVSALESNGTMHTFIVVYDPAPIDLVIDILDKPRRYAIGHSHIHHVVGIVVEVVLEIPAGYHLLIACWSGSNNIGSLRDVLR